MRTIIIIISVVIYATISAQSFKELQEIPRDSKNAETMKIWIPVESEICPVTVKILDAQNNIVRLLLDRRVTKGYYNIYWDKKDDSGKFVDSGEYKYAIISCSYKKLLPLSVSYQDGENSILSVSQPRMTEPVVQISLHKDSVRISAAVLNRIDSVLFSLISDSLFQRGEHQIYWNPPERYTSGDFKFKIRINDFPHYLDFSYNKK